MKKYWLIFLGLALPGVLMASIYITANFQQFMMKKIDFIIYDNQHENIAGLTKERFVDYLHKCGAKVDTTKLPWTVDYKGLFVQGHWEINFVETPGQKDNSN